MFSIDIRNKHVDALLRVKKTQEQAVALENKAQEFWERSCSKKITDAQSDKLEDKAADYETQSMKLADRANKELKKLLLELIGEGL